MCGIAGIFDHRGESEIDGALLRRMTHVLAHRGPDGAGFHRAPGIGLGHRRLAVVDLAGGEQPLFNEDGRVCVVFNGEIYNFRELARELRDRGHRFRTRCDTEVIVHAWEEWGERCVDRFNGMFAFALWDEVRQILFLARDRLGEKPLYYAFLDSGVFIFASEIKSLLCHPRLARELDPQAVDEFFAFGYVPDPRSIFAGVRKLAPAHTLAVRRDCGTAEPKRYWDVSFAPGTARNEAETCDELVDRLREAVRLRLVADVPLGAFLSGGVDSSGVVALMAGLEPKPIETFSIRFNSLGFDESAFSARVAERYGTNHHVKRVEPNAFDLLDSLATIYDEPFGDSSALPTYVLCAAARQDVTVALSGDGGDEVFAGYRRHRWHVCEEHVRSLLPVGLRRPLFGALGRCYPKVDWAPRPLRAKTTFQELARDPAAGYFSAVSVCNDDLRGRLFTDRLRRDLQGYRADEVVRDRMRNADTDRPLSRVQYVDLHTYLPGDILTKVDRASMASSLEVRVPILDHTFVEWAARIPPDRKLRGREGKHILKRALEPYLPRDVLYRPKQGFAVPLAEWFRGPLRHRIRAALTGRMLRDAGLIAVGFVAELLDQHESGARDHSAALWSLLAFESFLRRTAEHANAVCDLPAPYRAARG